MEEIVVLSKSSKVIRWEKYLPKTVIRVLLVESDDSTRQIITALLQNCSYKVVAVSDGLAAWETLKENPHDIDLILTELDLPAISGFALLALVMEHEACKNIPVIMMSSRDSMTMVLKCMLRGAADYLTKPMRKNELKNLWQHVWRRLTLRDGHHTAHGLISLPASQQSLEDSDESVGVNESFDVTMDLIGGIDKGRECLDGDKTCDEYVGPELGLSLTRTWSEKLRLSDESAFSRYVAGEPSSSGEPKTPSESHEKVRRVRCDHGSATTSSNQENIGGSSSLSTSDVKAKEGEGEGGGGVSQREAALMKFRLKRKDRCFDKKVRYQSRKKLAEQRPRVKGQFVRAVNSLDASK